MGKRLVPLLSDTPKGPKGQGGLALNEPRAILNGILWILRTGASCEDLPERYPPCQICHRWFQRWRKEGASDAVLPALADDLRERGRLDLRETFIDGTFAPEKKGCAVGITRRGKGARIKAVADAAGFPPALHVTSASPHEATWLKTLWTVLLPASCRNA